MIEGLKPYSEYRDSGQRWLGNVPKHWALLPNRALFDERRERNQAGAAMLSVTITRGIVPQRALLHESSKKDSSKADKSAYKVVVPGDIVYNKMRAWQGALGASRLQGIVSPAYVVLRPRSGVSAEFYHHLLRTPAFAKEAERWSYGITSDMWSLRPEHFKLIVGALPPSDEQAAIVRFLDHANRKIDRLIRAKRKLIALLNEQKQAIIQQVMFAGFVQQLPLNILRLPQEVRTFGGWSSASVGHLIQRGMLEIQDGNHGELHPKTSDYRTSGIPFLMASHVRPERIDFARCAYLPEPLARSLRIGFAKPGDVLLTHKATIGQVSLVESDSRWPFVMLSPQVTYYRSKTTAILQSYLFWYMQSQQFQAQLKVLSLNQSTRNYIGLLEQRNLVVSFPEREQQAEMVQMIECEVQSLSASIRAADQEIALLQEYRVCLTSDIVTGKLDVRRAAAALPEIDEADADEMAIDEPEDELELEASE